MRHWNGWGDSAVSKSLSEPAKTYLTKVLGELNSFPDATFEQVLSSVPKAKLVSDNQIKITSEHRLTHARGQSLPDWIAMRFGRISAFPDGVAYPSTSEEVQNLISESNQIGCQLIPYGGGTSVVGHINPQKSDAPVLTVDMRRMNQMLKFSEADHLATFEAGACGPEIEAQLNPLGFTLGHYPQSFEFSTLGGWIATRSSGQQSHFYGRIEDLFCGGHLETARGSLDLPIFPASAAGPDLREMILGSEGRFGIITRATVRIRRIPKVEKFYGVFFKNWESGLMAVRRATQSGLNFSMMRLSDPMETSATILLSGKKKLIAASEKILPRLGYGSDRCLLIFGITEERQSARKTYRKVMQIFRNKGVLPAMQSIGSVWKKERFLAPYLRNNLWNFGVCVDTLETAVPWSKIQSLTIALKSAITDAAEKFGESILVFSHLSHVYRDGASIYVTFLFRRTADPDELLERWKYIKKSASKTIIEHGGTISHQHGVGLDHAPYLHFEKGKIGMQIIESVQKSLDPSNLFNPAKLIQVGGSTEDVE